MKERRNSFVSFICILAAALMLILGLSGCGAAEDPKEDEPAAVETASVFRLAEEAVASAPLPTEKTAGTGAEKTEKKDSEETAKKASETSETAAKTAAGSSGTATASSSNSKSSSDTTNSESYGQGTPTPQQKSGSAALTCTVSVECGTILNNMDSLTPGKESLVPGDGVILADTNVTFSDGDTVFDVLKETLRKEGILFEFETTPMYSGVYIEGIANLYEFDCGPLSGWMYAVNGTFPNYGCGTYKVKNGDSIDWIYTCDLGRDIGGGDASGQRGR